MMRARWLVLLLLLAGCFFRDAATPRFFRPASTALEGDAAGAPSATGQLVRLQTVTGTPFLRERIVWRSSEVEYGLYEQRRWSELPASYVQRALESALRATGGIRLSDDFDAPALQVQVIAFDEVLAPAHVARVALDVSLRTRDRRRLLDRSFTAEYAIGGNDPATAATAMGRALDDVAAAVAAAVASAIAG